MEPFGASPLTFEPQLEARVWGGRALTAFGKRPATGEPIGESWEISDVAGKPSVVTGGPYAGLTLRELIERWPREVLGATSPDAEGRFPLLIKLLDARADLSVQVHPSDEDLWRLGLPGAGKTEAWVILSAAPGARVLYGIPGGSSLEALCDAMARLEGRPLDPADEARYLRWVDVAEGDVIFVPARTVHALGAGVVLLEVQQTSDITYRIHDWGRLGLDGTPRELHLGDARVLGQPPAVPCPVGSVDAPDLPPGVAPLLECEKFTIERIAGGATVPLTTGDEAERRCQILAGFRGAWTLRAAGESVAIERGKTVLLPAALGEYVLEPSSAEACCLRFWAP